MPKRTAFLWCIGPLLLLLLVACSSSPFTFGPTPTPDMTGTVLMEEVDDTLATADAHATMRRHVIETAAAEITTETENLNRMRNQLATMDAQTATAAASP